MSKDIKQIQEENRKAIICAVHGTDDYEEALKRELGKRCIVVVWDILGGTELTIYDYLKEEKQASFERFLSNSYYELSDNPFVKGDELKVELRKIIGKPLTLDRVLLSMEYIDYQIIPSLDQELEIETSNEFSGKKFYWNLTKQTLEEQTKRTQFAINELLNKE